MASVERLGTRVVEARLKRVSILMMTSEFEWPRNCCP
jgi:hypothetical protein